MSRIIVAAHASFCPGRAAGRHAARAGGGARGRGHLLSGRNHPQPPVQTTRCVKRVYAFFPKPSWTRSPPTHTSSSARTAWNGRPTSGLPPAGMPVPTRPVPMFGKSTRSFPRQGRTPPSSFSATKRTPRWSASAALRANGRISAAPRRRRRRSFPHVWRQTRRQSPSRKPPSTSANGKNFVNSSKTYIQTQKFLIQYAK